jgi:FtsH-binding integral membrane protein
MNTSSETTKTQNGLRVNAIFMIGTLVIQYTLGMITNMFVQFPDTDQAGQLWDFARSQFPTMAQIVIGTLLLVGAIVFVIRAAANHHRGWIASSVVGLIAILVAFFGGATFISTQIDGYSLLMALATIVAFIAYGWGLVAARR